MAEPDHVPDLASSGEMRNPIADSGVYPVMQPPNQVLNQRAGAGGPLDRRSAFAPTVDVPSTAAVDPPTSPSSNPPMPPPVGPPVVAGAAEVSDASDAAALVGVVSLEFSEFYRVHWRPVARGLAVTLGDRDLAAEATDEAMARAYPRWATLRTYDNPAGWVYRVGLNWARSYRRRVTRLIPFIQHDTVELDPVDDPAIRAALMDLTVNHRSVVVCRLLLDWSVDATAEALDISPGTVKSRLHRALTILESTLANQR